ncbi:MULTISPECIES: hypothetical protein [unclassified Pyramidobacter]|uniref:hypothetical protein n=1 Tax=unclassified Pyramidobacter TaxID=2632171 RepID=UPI00098F8D66|nr:MULTISPECIES: hypothetical protein [unclassified Pyramidobacter]MCI7403376.1 hypothetical protein [Pyramidobacter sp.]MDY3212502.1 hypothetical protein [Pyramidobacter sp.]OON89182.1 hypothetical protein B0D78_05140 [Pyramidobacter sp. C12-8]WOL40881.1 hypothetical protein RAH42_04385 [Pyramidobacter sp. YE332]
MAQIINMLRIDSEDLTIEQYLSLREKDKAKIKETRIIPPRLGDPTVGGKIRVTYTHPIYAPLGEAK